MRTRSTFRTRFMQIATASIAVTALWVMAVSPAAAQETPTPKKAAKPGLDIMLMQPKAVKTGENVTRVGVERRNELS